ncbi:MAG: cell division protein FtsZ, partial [Rubrivivax sp.]|nr:cell division protein FtsZ [Rubrivivax sp.]
RRARSDDGAGRVDPALGEAVSPPPPLADLQAAPLRRGARIDALIDAIVPLALEAPISGEMVIAHLPPTRRAGSKPFVVEGLDAETGEWDMPTPGRRYGELQAGLQLANRSGALNEIEYSEFVQKIQGFADAVGAMADFPDMLEVVARARELDGLASPLDAQLTVTLRSNSVAWSAAYIQQCAARHGFVPGVVPGRLVLAASEDGAPPVLALNFDPQAALADDPQTAPVRECGLSLDVPQTAASAEPFPAWHNAARSLSDDMDALLVDDHGEQVTLHAFAAIGQELGVLYRKLDALDLAAGSAAARRLFS